MITLIAAVAKNGCIGKDGRLPWRIPEDMTHFKMLTTGNVVVMGRKTWESVPEKFRPLPDRVNAVVTRQAGYAVPSGVKVFSSLDDVFASYAPRPTPYALFIIGGAEIYAQAIGRADALEITHVDQSVDGDAFFPKIDAAIWRETGRVDRDGFCFVRYERNI